ncbi:MAG: sigma-70 family RNA polymerase sigma factor [Phycisphaerales bacterium]|nr:sigma-70 family RNA polymerase sigma factor [Phycisphaerales bacterium]
MVVPLVDLTIFFERLRRGDPTASDQLYEIVYQELRSIAASCMARLGANHTLQPTALVNEAYLKLVGRAASDWETRAHFFGAAARAMRNILVDHARRKGARKRGGDRDRADVSPYKLAGAPEPVIDVLDLNGALDRLAQVDALQARVVELRFFGGLSVSVVAKMLQLSPSQVRQVWGAARARLRTMMRGAP